MKYFTKFLCQFVSFFLVFTIGFLSCIGVVVGGAAFVYCNVSIDKLNEWGAGIDTSGFFDEKADVPVNSLTLETLLGEILGIQGNSSKYSLQDLIDRYGLILPEEIAQYLPSDVILNTALETLVSQDGLMTILKNTPLNYLLQFVPEGVLSEEAKETMGTVALYDIIFPQDNNYASFLDEVQLGFFLGVSYTKDAEGNYVVDRQGERPTLLELLAPINLGLVLGLFTNSDAPESTVANVIYRSLGHIVYEDLLYSLGLDLSSIDIVDNILADRSVGDLFRDENGDGIYELYIPGAAHDLYLGTILGIDGEVVDGKFVVNYKDENQPTILELLAPLDFGGILAALLDKDYGKTALEVVFDTLGEIEFNQLFGSFLQLDKIGMEEALVGKKIKDLIHFEDGKPVLDVAGLFEGVYVGDFLGVKHYIDEDGNYVISEDDDSSAIARLVAFIDVGRIASALLPEEGGFDANKVIDATYNQVATIRFIDILHVFVPDTEGITGLDKALGDKTIGTVLSFDVETGKFDLHVPDVFKDIYLADFFGIPYHIDANGKVIIDDEIDTPLKLIAHISAYDFVNAIFEGDIFEVLYQTFGRIYFEDIFNLIPGFISAEYDYLYEGWQIGDFIVYDGAKWRFEGREYWEAMDFDRLLGDLKNNPDPAAIGILAATLAGRLVYLLFFNDITFREYIATAYDGTTLLNTVNKFVDTKALRIDRLLGDIDISRMFVKDDLSGLHEFSWYDPIKDIAFDDIIYIFVDYEAQGIDGIFGDATIGDLLVRDENGNFSFEPENALGFVYLDDLLNFILNFFGQDLEGIGLGGLYDDLPLSAIVIIEDGKVSARPDALFDNLRGTAWGEFEQAFQSPLALRSLVLFGTYAVAVAYDYFLDRDNFLAISFDQFIEDYNITNEAICEIIAGKTVRDLLGDGFSDILTSFIRFNENVRLATVLRLFGLDGNEAVNTIVSDTTFGDIVYVDEAGKIQARPLAVVEGIRFADILDLCGVTNEKVLNIVGDKRIGDLFHYDPDAEVKFDFTPLRLLGDIAFRQVVDVFYPVEDGTPLAEVLDALGTVTSLVCRDPEGNYHFTPVEWVQDIRFMTLVELARLQELIDRDLSAIFGDMTIGDILYYEDETLRFEWFALFRDIAFNAILDLFALPEQISLPLHRLFTETDGSDKTIGSIVNYSAEAGFSVTWYPFVDDMHIIEVVNMIGYTENEALNRLLGDVTVGDIIDYDEETKHVSVNELTYLSLTDLVNMILGFLGTDAEAQNIADLLADLTVASLITLGDGFALDLDPIVDRLVRHDVRLFLDNPLSTRSLTIVGVMLAWVLYGYFADTDTFLAREFNTYLAQFEAGTPYGHRANEDYLYDIFADKTFGDLLPRNLADFPQTLVSFLDGVSFYTIFGLLKIENRYLHNLLDEFYFNNIIFVNDAGAVDFHLENLDKIKFADIARLAGLRNHTLLSIIADMDLADLVTYNYNEKKFSFTPLEMIADIRLSTLFGFFDGISPETREVLDRMFDTTVGEIIFKDADGKVVFKPFALTDKIVMTDILEVVGLDRAGNEDLYDLLEGKTLKDVITSDDQTLKDVSVTLFETLFGYEVYDVLSAIVTLPNPGAWQTLLGHRTFSDLLSFTGLFENFTFNFDNFFGSMRWVDIIYAATGFEGSNIVALFGEKTIGTVLSISPEFAVSFTPFKLTDDMALVTILALVGIENEKVTRLLSGITLGDFVTSPDGTLSGVQVPAIQTILGLKVADVISLFYENERLNALLGERRFDDLIKVTGLFEDVTITFDNFFGNMKWVDIIYAATGLEGSNIVALFGQKTIGTVLSIGTDFTVSFTPFKLTDDMALVTILALVGIENDKVTRLLSGITLGDFVTSPDGSLTGVEVNAIQTILGLKVVDVIGLFYENEKLSALLGARRFDDLVKVTGLFEDVTVTFDDFFGGMKWTDILAVFGLEGANFTELFGQKTIGTVLSVGTDFTVSFTPFKLTDDMALVTILALFGIENDKVTRLLSGITLGDFVTSPDGSLTGVEVNAIQTILGLKVVDVIGLFYENEKLSALLGERRFDDLVKVTGLFENVTLTFDDFFGSMKWTDILAVFGLEGANITDLFGTKTIGTVLSISPEFVVSFTPFKLTDDMALVTLLALAGIEDEKVTRLLSGITLGDFVTSPDGTINNIQVPAIQTMLGLKVVDVIGLVYESAELNTLLGDRRFDDLVKVTGLFENVTVTFDDFFGSMALRDIVAVFAPAAVENGKPLAAILGETRIGDIISISPAFDVVIAPFALTDNVALTDVLALFGLTEGKVVDLLAGIYGRDLITYENGAISVKVIQTLLNFKVASVIGLFYENEKLNALLGDRRFGDLVSVTGLFESVTLTFDVFFGDMKWVDILAVFGLEGSHLTDLFGTKTIGTVLSIGEGFAVSFTPFSLTDDMELNTFLAIAGITGTKLNDLLAGIALRDFVTSPDGSLTDVQINAIQTLLNLRVMSVIGLFYENEKLSALLGDRRFGDLVSVTGLFESVTLTFDVFFGGMKWVDILAIFGLEGSHLTELFGTKTIGTVLSIGEGFAVSFTPFSLTDDMELNTFLAIAGITGTKLNDLLAGIALRDFVTSPDGSLKDVEVTAIRTVLDLSLVELIGLFYEDEALTRLLTKEDGSEKTFGTLVQITGLFETVNFTWYEFVSDMKIVDILRACYVDRVAPQIDLDELFGIKTVGDLLAQDENGANTRLTLKKFLEDANIIGFSAILDATGIDRTSVLGTALYNLIGDKYIADLLSFDEENNLTFTWYSFIADMELREFARMAGLDVAAEPQNSMFGTKTLGDLVGKDAEGNVYFRPFKLTDDIAILDILTLAGLTTGEKLNALLSGMTLRDLVTSPDGSLTDVEVTAIQTVLDLSVLELIGLFYESTALNRLLTKADGTDKTIGTLVQITGLFEDVTVTFDDFFGDMKWVDIIYAATGLEGNNIVALFGEKTIGTVLSISPEFAVSFTPFKLTDDMALNTLLALAGFEGTAVNDLLDGITLRGLVTSPDGSLKDVEVTAIQTILDLSLVKLVGLFYENEALTSLLTKADGTDKTLGTLVQITGLFEAVDFDIDAFVGDMKIMDFVGLTGGENASLQALLGDAAIGDFVTFNGGVKLQPIDFITFDGLINYILSYFDTDLLTLGLDRIVDGIYISQVIVVAEDGSVTFTAQPIFDNLDQKEELRGILQNPFSLRSLVIATAIAANLIWMWFFDHETLLDMSFIPDLLGNVGNPNLKLIFEGKTVRDLLGEGFARLHINATKFFAGVPLSVIPGLLKYENEDLAAILGDTTVDDIFYVDEADQFHFKPFALTDPVHVTNILNLCGVGNEKVLRLFEDITLEQLITSPHKTVFGIRLNAIQTLLAMKVANVVDLFYENEKLNALLGDRRFDDLVQVIGLFEDVTLTFDAFFGDMKWTDIFAVFGLEGSNVDELFGQKTIGTALSISPEFAVSFTPFKLTDDMALVTILAFAGLENEKVTRLLDGITLSDLVTSPNGTINNIQVPAIQTILGLKVANVIGLFYESAELNTLLGERRFEDLVQVTGLFESITVTFDNFFGSMALRDIVAVFAPTAVENGRPLAAILGETRIGDIISVSPAFDVTFAPFALTDNVALTDVLALFGLTEGKVVNFFDGIYGRDIVTSEGGLISITAIQTVLNFKVADTISLFYENEKLNSLLGDRRFVDLVQVNGLFASISVTFDAFFGGMKWVDILAVFGVEGFYIDELFGDKTIGTVISIDSNYNIILTPFKLTDDMRINTFLGMFGVEGTKLNVLFDGITLGDFVTSPDGSVFVIEITAIQTILDLSLIRLIGLFYEHPAITRLLTKADGAEKTLGTLVQVTGLFETVAFAFNDFFGDMKWVDILAVFGLEGGYITELFGEKTIGTVISIDNNYNVVLTPFKLTDDMKLNTFLAIAGITGTKLNDLLDGLTLGDFVTSPDGSVFVIEIPAIQTILDLSLVKLIGLFYENPALTRLLTKADGAEKSLGTLVQVTGLFENVNFAFDDFFGDMKWVDILALFGLEGSYITDLFGQKTIGTVLSVGSGFVVTLTPFKLTDDMELNTFLAIAGITGTKVNDLLDGIALGDFVTSPDGTINNIQVPAIQTVLGLSLVKLIGLFYENPALTRLLTKADGEEKSLGTLVQVTGLFESVTLTFNDFFGDMKWVDILALDGFEGGYIDDLFGEKTIGTVLSIGEGFVVTATPFRLTDDMKLNTFLAIAGITGTKLNDLLDGITLGDFVTSPDGSLKDVQITAIQTVLDLSLLKLIGLFYEHPALTRLLTNADGSDKSLGTLVQITGLFERVTITFNAFFGDMKWTDILALFGLEGGYINDLFGEKTIGTVVSVGDNFTVTLTPFSLTDDMELNTFLAIAGITGTKLNDLLDGLTLGDFVTSPDGSVFVIEITAIQTILDLSLIKLIGLFYEHPALTRLLTKADGSEKTLGTLMQITGLFENVNFAFNAFFGDMKWTDILALFSLEGSYIDELFGEKTIGTVLSVDSGFVVTLTPFKLTDDMKVNTFLAIAGITGTKLNALLDGLTLADFVTSPDGSVFDIQVTAIQTILDLSIVRVIGLFYEDEALTRLLTKEDGSEKTFGTLVQITGLFETVNFTWYEFVRDMKIVDILRACYVDRVAPQIDLDELFGIKTVGDLLAQDENGANTRLTLKKFLEDANIIGFSAILDATGIERTSALGTALYNLIGGKYIADLLSFDEENNLTFTWYSFIADMQLREFARMAGLDVAAEPQNSMFGTKTLGDLVGKDAEGNVYFRPFKLTDDIAILDILTLAGLTTGEKLNALLSGMTLGDFVTSPDGSLKDVEVTAIRTVLDLSLVELIGLFYENAALTHLLTKADGTDKTLGTLVQITGLFEDVNLDIDAFVGNMKLMDFVALTGYENAKLTELLGDSTIGDFVTFNGGVKLQPIDFITLDAIANFALSFAGTDLLTLGLDRIIDGIYVSQVMVVAADGSVTFTAQPIIDNLDMEAEINAILNNPFALRSLVFIGVGAAVVVYLWIFDRDVLLDLAFIPDLLGETEDVNLKLIFEGKTVRDLLGEGFARLHINATKFLEGVPLTVIPGLFKFENEDLTAMLGSTTVDDIFYVDEADQFHFKPFVLTDPMRVTNILGLCGVGNEKALRLFEDITLEQLITSPHKTVFGIEINAIQTLLALKVANTIGVFYENEKLNALLGDRRFDDLVQVIGLFEDVTLTFDAFFGDMKWTDIFAVFGLEGSNVDELFGDKTIGTVFTLDSDFYYTFTPFKLTDDMALVTILAFAGLENEKVTRLLDGITLSDLVTSPDGTINNIQVPAIQTILGLKVANVIGLFYESAELNTLLGERRFEDLVQVTGLFESITVTFDNFFGSMALHDIVAVFAPTAVENGRPLAAILGETRIGDIISVSPAFDVTFAPFALTDNVALTDVLALFGLTEGKVVNFFDGIYGRDIVTSEGGLISITAIQTVLNFKVADTISLFYENEKLNSLLGDRRFVDLVQVNGLFASISVTFDAFFGGMKWVDILAVFGVEGFYIDELFGTKTIGTVISIDSNYNIILTPFKLTDDMRINTFLGMFGLEGTKVNILLDGITLSDFVTSPDGSVFTVEITAIQTVLGLSVVELIGLFYENEALTRLLTKADGTDKTLGTLVQITGLFEAVALDIDAFVGNMKLMDFVALTGYENAKLSELLGDSTIGDFVTFNGGVKLQPIDFITLDAIANFALSFAGTDLLTLGLDRIIDGIYVSQVMVVAADGSVTFTAQPIIDNLDMEAEINAILNDPFAVRSLVFMGVGAAVLLYLWIFDRDVLLDLAFIPDLLGETEDVNLKLIFEGKTVRDLLGEGFARLHINATKFLAGVPLTVIPGLFKFENEDLTAMLGSTTVDDIFYVDEADQFHFKPFVLTDPMRVTNILGLCGVGNEKVLRLFEDITLEQLITSPHKTVFGIEINAIQTLLALKVVNVVGVFYESEALSRLLGGRRFDDLVQVIGLFEDVTLTFDAFFGNMKWTDIFAVFGLEDANVDELFGEKTISTLFTLDSDFYYTFTPFKLTDDMSLVTILAFAGLENEKVTRLLDGITLSDLVTSPDGNLADIQVTVLETVLAFKLADLIALTGVSHSLIDALCTNKSFDDFILLDDGTVTFSFSGLFGDVVINDVLNGILSFFDRSLEGWDMTFLFEGMVVTDLIDIKDGSVEQHIEEYVKGLDFKRIINTIRDNPFSEPSLVYIALGLVGGVCLLAMDLDGMLARDIGTYLRIMGVSSTHPLYRLLSGRSFDQLINVKGTSLNTILTWYDFVSDMVIADILDLLKITDSRILTVVGTKTVGDLVAQKEDGTYELTVVDFLGTLTVGDVLGTEGAKKQLIADFYLVDIYRVLKGTEGLTSIIVKRMGEKELYEIFKTAMGEQERLKTMLGHIAVNDVLVDNGTGGYKFDITVFETIPAGSLLGYTKREDGYWYDTEGVRVSGLVAAVADLTLQNMSTEVGNIKLGTVIGYTEGADGKWYDGETEATGLLAIFADLKINDMSDSNRVTEKIKSIQVKDVLGLTEVDGVWYTDYANGKKASPIIGALAISTVGSIEEDINDIHLGVVFGYSPVYDSMGNIIDWQNEEGSMQPGVLRALADSTIETIDERINNVLVGEVAGYVKVGDTWYSVYSDDGNDDNDVVATGVLKAFADLKIADMKDSATVADKIQNVYVGDVMGYYYNRDDHTWYADEASTPLSAIMTTIAGSKVGELNTTIDNATIGSLFGYKLNEEGKWVDAGGTEVSGYMKLVGPDTPFKDLNDKINSIKDTATIGEFIDAGLLELDGSAQTNLDRVYAYRDTTKYPESDWRDLNLTRFVSWMVSLTTMIP